MRASRWWWLLWSASFCFGWTLPGCQEDQVRGVESAPAARMFKVTITNGRPTREIRCSRKPSVPADLEEAAKVYGYFVLQPAEKKEITVPAPPAGSTLNGSIYCDFGDGDLDSGIRFQLSLE